MQNNVISTGNWADDKYKNAHRCKRFGTHSEIERVACSVTQTVVESVNSDFLKIHQKTSTAWKFRILETSWLSTHTDTEWVVCPENQTVVESVPSSLLKRHCRGYKFSKVITKFFSTKKFQPQHILKFIKSTFLW